MRLAVFAHYDKDNYIEQYVIYYLKELKKVADKIVFVSDSNLKNSELKKLDGVVDKTIAERHGEYDFGSYKRGYLYLKNNDLLRQCDELIFANDSCFGPLVSFQKIWTKMNSKAFDNGKLCVKNKIHENNTTCDFWGITEYKDETTPLHIQSYFLVFKRQVFNNAIFDNFMKSVKKELIKMDVVRKYEIGLSQVLLANKFKMHTLIKGSIESAWLVYLLHNPETPFIKTMIVKNNFRWLSKWILGRLWLTNKTTYNINLILDYASKYRNYNIKRKIKNLKRSLIRFSYSKKAIYVFGKNITQ